MPWLLGSSSFFSNDRDALIYIDQSQENAPSIITDIKNYYQETWDYIFDDSMNVMGSFNLDDRSSYINSEYMVVISSPEFTKN